MGSIYQVAKIKSLSIYCNSNCSEMLLGNENETEFGDDWILSMQHSLETFKFNKKENLDFSKFCTSVMWECTYIYDIK